MSAIESNKQLLQHVFAELAEGRSRAFLDALADDVRWAITGSSAWAGTWEGKGAVRAELLGPLFDQFADRYTNTARRFIAEDDLVAVECNGSVTTKAGERYENAYCWIFRLDGGKVREITEYMDTALAEAVLQPPAGAPVRSSPSRSSRTLAR